MSVRAVSMISFHTCPLASWEGKETGGMNVYVLELSKELSRQGIAVDVFTRSQDQEQPHIVQVNDLFRVIHLPAGEEKPIPKKQLIQHLEAFAENYLAFVAKHGVKYDVMHCHYYLSGMIGQLIAEKSGEKLPLIMTFHTLALMKNLVARDELEREEKERIDAEFQLVSAVDKIIAPSQSDQNYLQYLYQADNKDKVVVIPPGVDLDNFKPMDHAAAKAHLGIDPHEKIILFCGRIEPLKGIDMLLYAMKIMVEKTSNLKVSLWIIGGDVSQPPAQWSSELQKLEKLRHVLKLTSLVHFAGQQLQEVLPYYYNAADVVVMPSHYESFGMVAAEAMACGVPIITSNVAGISHLLEGKSPWLLTSVNNPLLLASQMEQLLTDEHKHAQVSQAVYETVQDLTWQNVTRQIINAYEAAFNNDNA